MRHGKKFNHLGRKSAHRKAMLANMACSLIEHKQIKTTVAKAKALRKYVEPLITKAKTDTTHSRRVVFSYLQNKEAIKELFGEVINRIGERPGGYTRILKLGNRLGDNAEMAMIELVDFNEYAPGKAGSGGGKRRRRRRSGGGSNKKKTTKQQAATAKETPAEEAIEDVVAEEVVAPVEEVVENVADAVEEVKDEVVETVEETVEAVEEVAEEVTEAVEETVEEVTETVVEEVEEAVEETVEAVEEVTETVAPDDLKKIEGIGPKIASILNEAGIMTFAELAGAEVDKLKEILEGAGSRYKAHDPSTWPQQAGLAAEGKWDELQKLQDELDGGREK